MGILEILNVGRPVDESALPGANRHSDTETIRRIVVELKSFEPARARFLAGFAYVLNRVAHADSNISLAEKAAIRKIVRKLRLLSEKQAPLVLEIAQS